MSTSQIGNSLKLHVPFQAVKVLLGHNTVDVYLVLWIRIVQHVFHHLNVFGITYSQFHKKMYQQPHEMEDHNLGKLMPWSSIVVDSKYQMLTVVQRSIRIAPFLQ